MIFIFYITALVFSFLLTIFITRLLIPKLKNCAKQPIYEDGPAWHSTKAGTPTMGGLSFLIAIAFTLLVSSFFLISIGEKNRGTSLLITTLFCILNSLIGVFDDLTKLRRRKNAGLTPKQKLVLQALICALFFLVRLTLLRDQGTIVCTVLGFDLKALSLPLMFIVFLGLINCANLTDGIDGLASCVTFSIGLSLFYIFASTLNESAITVAALMGGVLGFLVFNLHPAKIFMGDTGSLFLGALIASTSLSLDNPLTILPVSGIYVIEGVSVILQVLHYKATKKRLFKMAPLHHHLEKTGFSENTICIIAILATLIFSIPTFIFS